MKVGDRVRVRHGTQLCWKKSGKVYIPSLYVGYVTYVNHYNGNLMVYLEELGEKVQTSIEDWKVESEDATKWYDCPHCDAGYPDQKCICKENEE